MRVAFDKDYVGRFDRHVRARTNGNADIGLRERGGVIHAVARHRGDQPAALHLLDLGDLLVGKDLRDDFIKADFFRDPIGNFLLVTREHNAANAHRFQAGNGFF